MCVFRNVVVYHEPLVLNHFSVVGKKVFHALLSELDLFKMLYVISDRSY